MPQLSGLALDPDAVSPTAQSSANGNSVPQSEQQSAQPSAQPSAREGGPTQEICEDGGNLQAGPSLPTDPDGIVEYCLMAGLHSVTDAELPIMTSDFYSKHMLPNKPLGAIDRFYSTPLQCTLTCSKFKLPTPFLEGLL